MPAGMLPEVLIFKQGSTFVFVPMTPRTTKMIASFPLAAPWQFFGNNLVVNKDVAEAIKLGLEGMNISYRQHEPTGRRVNPQRRKLFALIPSERRKRCPHTMVAHSGRTPCTGPIRCLMCGKTMKRA